MSRAAIRPLLYGALLLAFLLHNDLWLWNDARLVLGLPVGLVYHIGFCVGVARADDFCAGLACPRALLGRFLGIVFLELFAAADFFGNGGCPSSISKRTHPSAY